MARLTLDAQARSRLEIVDGDEIESKEISAGLPKNNLAVGWYSFRLLHETQNCCPC